MVMVWPGSTRIRSTPPQVQLLLVLYATVGCFLLPTSRHASVAAAGVPISFSFNFSRSPANSSDELKFEGDACLKGGFVDLTCKGPGQSITYNRTGRMSYSRPVQFYDKASGVVASFSTRFTFAIKPYQGGDNRGDGMAFFLTGYPSKLPVGSSGGFLGLDDGTTALGPKRYAAVEFDTCNNTWDPMGTKVDHIGIVISSVQSSSNTTNLNSSSLNGTMTASISFNSTTKMFIASLQFHDLPSRPIKEVSMQLPHDITSVLPPQVAVGFSAATGDSFELHQIISWSFNSTFARPRKCRGTCAAVIRGGAILLVPVIWFILSWYMWRRAGISFVKRTGLGEFRRFKYRHLVEATSNFSPKNKLGDGKFGVVYKGIMKKHKGEPDQVAVKQIKKSAMGEASDFISELKASSRTSHKNLVRLKGWCCSRIKWKLFDFMFCTQRHVTDLFIIYELVPNGTLLNHLKKDMQRQKVRLSWETRYGIAKGIASGLCYLHHGCKPYILHRDIKPDNILLDADFSPKLGDFGLSRIANNNNLVPLTGAVGTKGYMDPLCMKNGKVKFGRPSDVYSFGVVLLDIACTGKTRYKLREMYGSRTSLEKFIEDAAHVKPCGYLDRMQMQQVIVLGLLCCLPNDAHRPSMQDAVKVLDNDITLLKKGMEILENDTPLLMGIVDDGVDMCVQGGNASNMASPGKQ